MPDAVEAARQNMDQEASDERKRDFWFLPMEKGLSVVASTI